MAVHIGADIGGTFTGLAAYDARTGRIRYTKSLTTHARPIDGIRACVDKVGIDLGEAALFRHGATLVINKLLEMDGARVALVTTRWFSRFARIRPRLAHGGVRPVLPQAAGARAAPPAPCSVRPPIRKPRPSEVGRLAGLMATGWLGARRYRLKGLKLEIL
jgi:Hydantoinase/oxoprolinase N-terminal region